MGGGRECRPMHERRPVRCVRTCAGTKDCEVIGLEGLRSVCEAASIPGERALGGLGGAATRTYAACRLGCWSCAPVHACMQRMHANLQRRPAPWPHLTVPHDPPSTPRHTPVVAIGGVNAGNVADAVAAGASGAAVVSGLFAAADPTQATRELRRVVDAALGAMRHEL